jgi:hypothetical protein
MSSQRIQKRRATETQFEEYSLTDLLGETATFTTQSISDNCRRTHQRTHAFDLPSLLKKIQMQWDQPSFFADVRDGFEYVFEELTPAPSAKTSPAGKKPRTKRYLSSVHIFLGIWLEVGLMVVVGPAHAGMDTPARRIFG